MSIAQRLKKDGFIRNPLVFRLLVMKKGIAHKIQAGSFSLSPSFSTEVIAETLTHGTADVWLTFPEGWRKEEYAALLATKIEDFDTQKFISQAEEGSLFPDTYLIPKKATVEKILAIFKINFQKKLTATLIAKGVQKGLTRQPIIILASLVEREVRTSADRAKVAGILIKRLRADWPLQVDATLQYLQASQKCQGKPLDCDWWPKALAETKKVKSSYNTYLYQGLPVGPICNPGLNALEAVVNFEESDYWFYLSDSSGKIHYASTSSEHNQNITQYLLN